MEQNSYIYIFFAFMLASAGFQICLHIDLVISTYIILNINLYNCKLRQAKGGGKNLVIGLAVLIIRLTKESSFTIRANSRS